MIETIKVWPVVTTRFEGTAPLIRPRIGRPASTRPVPPGGASIREVRTYPATTPGELDAFAAEPDALAGPVG